MLVNKKKDFKKKFKKKFEKKFELKIKKLNCFDIKNCFSWFIEVSVDIGKTEAVLRREEIIPKEIGIEKNKWLNRYFNTPDDYYFLVENNLTGEKDGLISIYNVKDGVAELGRWVIKKGSMATIESMSTRY